MEERVDGPGGTALSASGHRAPRAPDVDLPPFPDLTDLVPLGSGARGSVFRARQPSLDRAVVVRTPPARTRDDAGVRRRFEKEARMLARVQHANVVPVYTTGVARDMPYAVTRYVAGDPLVGFLSSRSWQAVAEAFRRVAAGLDAAHRRGVLHRGLRPSSIRVDERAEPILLDFELGGDPPLDAPDTDPATLQRLDYAAPELLEGTPCSKASDVYALGALLYRVLTGRAPFEHVPGERGREAAELRRRVLEERPELPRRIDPGVPAGLQAICLQALERSPRHRYPTAGHLAEDLGRVLTHHRVAASPPLFDELVRQGAERHVAEIDDWVDDGILEAHHRERLAEQYEQLTEGERESVYDAVRTPTSVVFLYVAAVAIALGPALMSALAWERTPIGARIALTLIPFAACALLGRALWRRGDARHATPLWLGAALILPTALHVGLHHVPPLAQVTDAEGARHEVVLDAFSFGAPTTDDAVGRVRAVLDKRLLIVSAAALAAGVALRRRTRSPAFVWYVAAAGFAVLYFGAAVFGWRSLAWHWRAAVFVPPPVLLIVAGSLYDRRKSWREARACFALGFLVLVAAWWLLAGQGYPIARFYRVDPVSDTQLSIVFGGLTALLLGIAAGRVGTPIASRFATVVLFTASACVFLGLDALARAEPGSFGLVLPAASLLFIGFGVALGRPVLLWWGGAALADGIFRLGWTHLEGGWRWALAPTLAGAVLALFAFWAPGLVHRLERAARRPA